MLVHVIADSAAKLAGIRAVLERKYAVTAELIGGPSVQRSEPQALVIRADLRTIHTICKLKPLIGALQSVQKRIFLVEETAHLSVSQAYALGATDVLVGPLNPTKLQKVLAEHAAAEPLAETGTPRAVAAAGEIALASMFTAVATGSAVDIAGASGAGGQIADAVEEHGLSDWLSTVRRHHEGTYQHCLLVTGIAVDFGLSLGVPKADVERLYSAAMFHDIGKAKIPLALLDKPGRLEPKERALIETHPGEGYDILRDNGAVSREILDAVRHHHEYLDGSGYPDGLCANSISDLVRVMTISDIFAALIENRAYRQPLSRHEAYDILSGMHGKLEKPLLNAFKEVALSR